MTSRNVSYEHGGHETNQASDGTWRNSAKQKVVYVDFSEGRGTNGPATAVVWGAPHKQLEKRRGLDNLVS